MNHRGGRPRSVDPRLARLKTSVSAPEQVEIERRAAALGLSVGAYLRLAGLGHLDVDGAPGVVRGDLSPGVRRGE
jgi:hypothetical protein